MRTERDAPVAIFTAWRLVVRRRGRRYLRILLDFARRNPVGAFAGILLLTIVIAGAAAPIIAPHSALKADFQSLSVEPNAQYLLGTDQVGRGVLSRIIVGTRTTLIVAGASVFFGTTIGALLGVASAYLGGKLDLISQRILEVFQAFPDLILALLLMAALQPGLWTVIAAIAVTRVPFGGRVVRSVALQVREMDYITSAKVIGASDWRIMWLHVAPQCVAPYLVLATAHLGVAIIIEASLGFLGAGVPPPTPTWGNMLAQASISSLKPLWWLVVFPGLAITITVLAFNLLGDSLRDTLDPRLRGQ